MEKLNKLIWPLLLQEAKREIQNLFRKGHDIIVLEAAVLIQAEWQNECSEIWTCIIPQNEVSLLVLQINHILCICSDRNLFVMLFYILCLVMYKVIVYVI